MSVWSNQKRFRIILTLITVLSFIVTSVLFFSFYNPPRCDDGLQNGSEQGVDCGGICENICPIPPEKLVTLWDQAFPLDESVYAAVAYVDNRNESLYIPSIQYEFVFYDIRGTAITRASQRTQILPGGITPIFVPHVLVGEREIAYSSFRFVTDPQRAFRRITTPKPTFSFGKVDIHSDTTTSPYATTTVRNTSTEIVREVEFIIILYDRENRAVAASRTFERDIAPQETRELYYTWVNPFVLEEKVSCPGGLCDNEVVRAELLPIATQ